MLTRRSLSFQRVALDTSFRPLLGDFSGGSNCSDKHASLTGRSPWVRQSFQSTSSAPERSAPRRGCGPHPPSRGAGHPVGNELDSRKARVQDDGVRKALARARKTWKAQVSSWVGDRCRQSFRVCCRLPKLKFGTLHTSEAPTNAHRKQIEQTQAVLL